jgi:hypothetical protein
MNLYVFSSVNWENIWIGFRHRLWAVSRAEEHVMKARRTRAKRVEIGDCGILYVHKSDKSGFTVPFYFKSMPDVCRNAPPIWPEEWEMPFEIEPLGSPNYWWLARHAAESLPFNATRKERNLSKVFNCQGTAVFAPIEIGEEDWAILRERLARPLHLVMTLVMTQFHDLNCRRLGQA